MKETYEDGWYVFRLGDGVEVCRALWMGGSYLVIGDDDTIEACLWSEEVVSRARARARARTHGRPYAPARPR